MTPVLEGNSFSFSLPPLPSFTLVSIPRSFLVVALSRTSPTLVSLLVSLGTLAFYRQRALTLEAWDVGFASVVTRAEAAKGECSTRGGKGAEKGGRKRRREKERDIYRTAAGWSARTVEGTVGALNPFKYNQYRGVPSTLSVIWMIFTVHSYNP